MLRNAGILLLVTVFAIGCVSPDDPNARAKRGAAIGAAAGAIAGAIIGNQGGNEKGGAVIGAVAGAAIGGGIGRKMDKQEQELREIEGVEVSRPSESEIEVRMTSDILFDVNSAALRPESQSTLRDLARNFAQYPENLITVEGHTDSTGSDDHNQRLSERRAGSVREYLVDQGVRGTSIDSRGYGELRPKSSNDTPEGRQLNRRVEIHIRGDEAGSKK